MAKRTETINLNEADIKDIKEAITLWLEERYSDGKDFSVTLISQKISEYGEANEFVISATAVREEEV